MRQAFESEERQSADITLKGDGDIEVRIVSIPMKEDSRTSILSALLDITEQKHAEDALRKSEESLAKAQHIARIGSWEWSIHTGEVTWSPELYSIYGLDPNSFTPTMDWFIRYVHPDDQELVNGEILKIDL